MLVMFKALYGLWSWYNSLKKPTIRKWIKNRLVPVTRVK